MVHNSKAELEIISTVKVKSKVIIPNDINVLTTTT